MEKNPFEFSKTNPRMVENALRSNNVYYGAAAIFLFSMHKYNRMFFRKDGNAVYMLAFTCASAPAAYSISDFALGSAATEAAMMNNEKEMKH